MICQNCGATVPDGTRFCSACGKSTGLVRANPAPAPYRSAAPSAPIAPRTSASIPPEYRPLGAWAYFGYSLLFAIPLVGFICLIVFSFSDSNINRRNFARSYWCALLIGVIFAVIMLVILAATGYSLESVMDYGVAVLRM